MDQPLQAEKITEQGQRKVLRDHTYDCSFSTIA